MSSPESEPVAVARVLARKAAGDAKVMRKLAADPEIGDEAVGFHAQQAVEKWLKAVISNRGIDFEYKKIRLRYLIDLAGLGSEGAPFDTRRAVDLTEYAVPLRYEDLLDQSGRPPVTRPNRPVKPDFPPHRKVRER